MLQSMSFSLSEKCPYSEFFWSVFSRIQTESERYGVSLHIQSEYGEIWTRKTPNIDTFQAVLQSDADANEKLRAKKRQKVIDNY